MAAPSANYQPASAPTPEALNSQGNTARDNKDYAEAMRLYREAAAVSDAAAMNHIGRLYQNGWGLLRTTARRCAGIARRPSGAVRRR
jgi:TPR repeat protein